MQVNNEDKMETVAILLFIFVQIDISQIYF